MSAAPARRACHGARTVPDRIAAAPPGAPGLRLLPDR